MLLAAGLQDSSNWGVPNSGVLHDQGQEELPPPQPSCHGLCLPLQAGQPPSMLSVGTHAHAFFAVQRATYCGPCWAIRKERKRKEGEKGGALTKMKRKQTLSLTACQDCMQGSVLPSIPLSWFVDTPHHVNQYCELRTVLPASLLSERLTATAGNPPDVVLGQSLHAREPVCCCAQDESSIAAHLGERAPKLADGESVALDEQGATEDLNDEDVPDTGTHLHLPRASCNMQ